MQFLRIEADRMVNLELVDIVELKHNKQVASLWTGGVIQVPDSAICYAYFAENQGDIVTMVPSKQCGKCSALFYTDTETVNHVIAAH